VRLGTQGLVPETPYIPREQEHSFTKDADRKHSYRLSYLGHCPHIELWEVAFTTCAKIKSAHCSILSIPVHGDIDIKHRYHLLAIGHCPKANLPGAAVEFRKRGREAVVHIV